MLCEAYSIDRSRTYLAAQGAGTDAALRLLLMHPSLCHGIAMFNPRLTYMPEMIESDDRREPVRALLVHTVQRDAPIREMFAFGRLLHAARMRLTTHFCLPNRIPWGRLLEDWFAKDQAEEPAWCCHW
jgi:pimeloyl-ACP methyl ester carboxylesterase